jgi:hypothetical protein
MASGSQEPFVFSLSERTYTYSDAAIQSETA